jgi:hypothetical protein
MNINLSFDEIEIVRQALDSARSSARVKRDELLDAPEVRQGVESDELILAGQKYRAIGATLAKVEEEVGKHYSTEMLIHWKRATA